MAHTYDTDQSKAEAMTQGETHDTSAGIVERLRGKPFDVAIEEAVSIYRNGRVGIKWLAKRVGCSHSSVRRRLIKEGIYQPEPCAKLPAGETKAEKARDKARQRRAYRRAILAKVLRGLRAGKGVQTVLAEIGVNLSCSGWVSSHYKVRQLLDKRKPRNPRYYWNYRKSRAYKTETEFQDAVESAYSKAGVGVTREAHVGQTQSRVDFVDECGRWVECKVATDSGSAYIAIGQAVHYRKHGAASVFICIPDDVRIRDDMAALLSDVGATVVTLTQLGQLIAEGVVGQSETTMPFRRTQFVCKCCGKSSSRRSRSASHYRSYCVECEPLIPTMTYSQETHRWVPAGAKESFSLPHSPGVSNEIGRAHV